MRGLWIENNAVRFRDDLAPGAAPPGESRVRVLSAGICATDLALARGYMGFTGVPGHEFVGRALDGPHAGRRVVGEINAICGTCAACRGGLARHCPQRSVLGILHRPGAFAEELSLPDVNLHPLPDEVSLEQAVFTEPLAAAFEIASQLDLERCAAAGPALVVGDGRLGLLCAQVLALHGLHTQLAGRHAERGAWFDGAPGPGRLEHIGPIPAPPQAGCPLPFGERWPLVVEATGDPEVFPRALGLVRPGGTLVLKTTSERPVEVDLAPCVVDEITIVGSRCGPFEPALAAMAAGRVRLEPLLTARYPLEQGPHAFQHAALSGTLKILIDVDAP